MLRDAATIACADSHVHESERAVLIDLASRMEVDPVVVHDALLCELARTDPKVDAPGELHPTAAAESRTSTCCKVVQDAAHRRSRYGHAMYAIQETPAPRGARPTSHSLVGLVAASAVLAACGGGAPPATSPVDYTVGDETYPLVLSHTELGIVARPGTQRDVIEAFAADAGGTVTDEHADALFVVTLDQPRTRTALDDHLWSLRGSLPNEIARIGFVLREGALQLPAIATEEVTVRAATGAASSADAAAQFLGLTPIMVDPNAPEHLLYALAADGPADVFDVAAQLDADPAVKHAWPNFVNALEDTVPAPGDELFDRQWHLHNGGPGTGTGTGTGAAGRTEDADLDILDAWDFGYGTALVAAVETGGTQLDHPDLVANLWTSSSGTHGYDYAGCTVISGPGCGDSDPSPEPDEYHGTAVAGLIAATADNTGLGTAGACPGCSLMSLRAGSAASDYANGLGIEFALANGARVINNSWKGGTAEPNTMTAIADAANAGIVLVFSATNDPIDTCNIPRLALEETLVVAASSNQDRRVNETGHGACVDVLAPGGRGENVPLEGTEHLTTTDLTGTTGKNNHDGDLSEWDANCHTIDTGHDPGPTRDYTECYQGTSGATALVSGVAGLVLTADPGLTAAQVHSVLRDTADRIEDSVGQYATSNGESAPSSGEPTHGFGRVNAYEAVKLVAPIADGGRGGIDVVIRDNRLDWGNTAELSSTNFEPTRTFLPHWQSVDIKVDAPPFQTAPTTPATFEALVDEDPIESAVNRVFVRVRNRGPTPAAEVTVKLHWAFAGTALPPLPSDFWSAFPADSNDTSTWHPMPAQLVTDLAYSGSSIAGETADAAQIVQFDFDAPAVDHTANQPRHHCVFAVLDSPDDPISTTSMASWIPDFVTPRDNNITHRNLSLQDAATDISDAFFVRNPYDEHIESRLELRCAHCVQPTLTGLPLDRPFPLVPGAEVLVEVGLATAVAGDEVQLVQWRTDVQPPQRMGGFTLRFPETDSDETKVQKGKR